MTVLNAGKLKLLAAIRRLDLLLFPFTIAAAILLFLIRRAGIERMPISKAIFNRVGVFPITDHYYEPSFNTHKLKLPLSRDRHLPGIDMNALGQLKLINRFNFGEELRQFPRVKQQNDSLQYSYDNGSFGSGDAEFLYSMIRVFKPKRFLEVGSGNSTLLARSAINMNKAEDPAYTCAHTCIEPYEAPWLERLGVEVIRRPVEQIDKQVFAQLEENDILFIDSSHIIRPQGDVLFLHLEVIPSLRPGVLIHVHDIFTPRDYLEEWILDQVKLWNEQYLLEALLSDNPRIEIVGALNFLKHHYPAEISRVCPILKEEIQAREPGSIWLLRK